MLQYLIFLLQTLFDMLLLQSFDMDLLQPAAEAFLALICCHQVMTLLISTQIVNPDHTCEEDQSFYFVRSLCARKDSQQIIRDGR